MLLSELITGYDFINIAGDVNSARAENVTSSSKEADANSIFIAIKGFSHDGNKFIPELIKGGVKIFVADETFIIPEDSQERQLVFLSVKDTRDAMAFFGSKIYNEPSKKLTLIGITGTKGKTTTAFMIKELLEFAGCKVGLMGTIANYIGKEKIETKLTTPDSLTINNLLAKMVLAGCTHCVMEVSSHAVELNRVGYLDFDYGIFTNITSDHMDFHHNFENYFAAKKKFFTSLKKSATVIVNYDDSHSLLMIENSSAKIISYGINIRSDYNLSNINVSLSGTKFKVKRESECNLTIKHIGAYNAYNATAAYVLAKQLDLSDDLIIEGVSKINQVPGRFEIVGKGKKKIIVDYSHTADSLEKTLEAIKEININNYPVYTIFGCGGDRDRTKRSVMGKIASENSNFVYITSDNPRSENPYTIIDEIKVGINWGNFKVIENREEAIKTAIMETPEKCIILIAGKGHENYQEINGERSFFSDKEIAEKYL